ncbi:MAG: hypothetical protein LUI14_10920 [Lachnospiraceae bacterium]|nr:hypothetical protein [Lachnospiraceae bacterium]
MGQVLKLKDGRITTVFSLRDGMELIEEYGGHELRCFLEEEMSGLQEELDGYKEDADSYEKELDQARDRQHSLLCDIREEAETVSDLLDADRLDRRKLRKAVDGTGARRMMNCKRSAGGRKLPADFFEIFSP